MELERLHELAKGYMEVLRLKNKPVGIKFFEKIEDVPAEYEWLKKRKAVCNVIGTARFNEAAIAITKENTAHLCVIPDVALSMGEAPAGFPNGAAGKFVRTPADATKMISGMKKLPKAWAAMGVCPLDTTPVVPDVVQIWGNPTQMMCLEYANLWTDGSAKVQLCSNGHGASCYEALSWPLATGEVRLAIADIGDKRHGYAADDDMILGMPVDTLEPLYQGLIDNQKTLNRLPVIYNFDDIDFPMPGYCLSHNPALK
jgi:uncharacterized protein (DUF169 family)